MINKYSSRRRKIDLNDWNSLIDHYNNTPRQFNDYNSDSQLGSYTNGKTTNRKWHPFELDYMSTSAFIVRQARWFRNGQKATPANIDAGYSIGTGSYDLDQKFTFIDFDNTYFSTSADDTSYNGMIYLVAVLDNSTETENYDDYSDWNTSTFDNNPALYPNKYHISKVKESEIGDLYSGLPTHMDSCKTIIAAHKIDYNGWPVEQYQYVSADIIDQLDAHPWDCFKYVSTSASFYMLPGYLYVNANSAGENLTPSGITTINGINVYNETLTVSTTNYIYLKYVCGTAGATLTIENSTAVADAESDDTSFRKLLWTVTLGADGKPTSHRRNQLEDVIYWGVVSDVTWDRNTSGKLEYKNPNCTIYTEITQATDCPST